MYRGKEPLIVDPWSDDECVSTAYHNCLLIDDSKAINKNSPRHGGEGGVTLAFQDAGDYVYLAGDYTRHYAFDEGNPAKNIMRQSVYLRPDIMVIMDRFEPANPAYKVMDRIHFSAPPDVNGNVISSWRGDSAVSVQFFSTSPVTTERVAGKYQERAIDILPDNRRGPQTIVLVVWTGAKNATAPAAKCDLTGANVIVSIAADKPIQLTLNADGRPGGTVAVGDQQHQLATTIEQKLPE